ncbi:MAG: hypothetical protein ACREBS_02680 [Nitrososphaerales archaeon]
MSLLDMFLHGQQARSEKTGVKRKKEEKEVVTPGCLESNILDSVGIGLARFGDSVPQVVLHNLKWLNGIEHEEIPSKPEEFEKCLDHIFRSGSAFVKRAIIEEVKAKFGLAQDYPSLKDCFESAGMKCTESRGPSQ